MRIRHTISVLSGFALSALLVNCSAERPAFVPLPAPLRDPGATALNAEGRRLYSNGRYLESRSFFLMAAQLADAAGDDSASAMNRNNVGTAEMVTGQFAEAMKDLNEARRLAQTSGQMRPLLFCMDNLANLYIQIGQPDNAVRVAREGLDGPAGHADAGERAMLLFRLTSALANLKQFDQAKPLYDEARKQLTAVNRQDAVVGLMGMWGNDNLRAGSLAEAELALNEGLGIARRHNRNPAYLLTGLAKLAARQHKPLLAEDLFADALSVREDGTPRWRILADRGRVRLESGRNDGALGDFLEAGRLASQFRADMVPADQDRVAFETGIGQFLRGLVEAGNRVALAKGSAAVIAETFDAAQQNKLWSLRAILPGAGDWRSRLSPAYWEKLARYQAMQRRALGSPVGTPEPGLTALKLELQEAEAAAGGHTLAKGRAAGNSALKHVRSLLDRDTTLFSFHISEEGSWMWAVTASDVRVFRLPTEPELRKTAEEFVRGGMNAEVGLRLYSQLFGSVPQAFLRSSHWLLEPDGPLHDIPFAALRVDRKGKTPEFLVERASLQLIPGALLLQKRAFRSNGAFIGVGDPVYNAADPRFHGEKRKPEFSLPRLPRTAVELQVSSRVWGPGPVRLLTGMNASAEQLWKLAEDNPSVVHFATHVVAGKGEYRSGLIALSLGPGGMDLLGPQEILARAISADLIVMNGCHSAQGETIPSSGRMGLTRAWIGAGAGGVLATQWDVADDDAESIMRNFYRMLKEAPEKGVAEALRKSQLAAIHSDQLHSDQIHSDQKDVARWAAYYLLSRAL